MTPHERDVIEQLGDRVLGYLLDPPSGDLPVVSLATPTQIAADFDDGGKGVGLALGEEAEAHPVDQLLHALDVVVDRSVHTAHPRFMNQNFAGADPISVIGDWLATSLNTTAATYEAAPVFTLMESAVLTKLATMVGFAETTTTSIAPNPPGIFCPGGSTSLLYALQLARHRHDPDINRVGMGSTRFAIFVSESGHYSASKSAALLGLGTEAVVKVPTDSNGAIQPEALAEAIMQANNDGMTPLAVIGTAGTTVTAAFDDLEALADICSNNDLWFHVDGCYGGSALFSQTYAPLLDGVERADSVSWNLHKMMGMTQQCSALLVRKPDQLHQCFALGADYLFQPDKLHAEWDSGDRTFQCARRIDVFKLWLSWKHHGDAGFAGRIDHAVSMANHARGILEASESFAVVSANFTNVVFAWIPPYLRPFDLATAGPDILAELHRIPPKIKAKLQAEGSAMIGFQPTAGFNTFRILIMNSAVQTNDIDAVIERIDHHGQVM